DSTQARRPISHRVGLEVLVAPPHEKWPPGPARHQQRRESTNLVTKLPLVLGDTRTEWWHRSPPEDVSRSADQVTDSRCIENWEGEGSVQFSYILVTGQ